MFHVEQIVFPSLTINYKKLRYFVQDMSCSKTIMFSALLLWLLSVTSLSVFAQSKLKKTTKQESHKTTFGIQLGKESSFTHSPFAGGKHAKTQYTNKSLILKRQLSSHLKVEAGLNVGTCNCNKQGTGSAVSKVSLPLTLQYYFLPEKYKIRPYCGAGVQGNIVAIDNIAATSYEGRQQNEKNSGTKNITILFTQGVTFEVNTRIQVNQSLHFIPGNNTKVIGIDFGVGYKFP